MSALEDEATRGFRREVRGFLDDWTHLEAYLAHGPHWPEVVRFFRALGERGWLSLAWPQREGGRGARPLHEYVLWDEVAYARTARNPLCTIVARTLLRAGTPEQRREWLPRIRAGQAHFALAYSEPEAGSDLAALRTTARREGDVYRIDGEKCWQSYAGHVDHLWLLARSGEAASRGRGLSLLIVDTRSPGLTIQPLPTLDGDALYACHFEGCRVPVERRVGPENGAWRLMAQALADERHIQFPAGRLRRDLDEIVGWVREMGLDRDRSVRTGLAELAVRVLEAELLALRVVEQVERGRDATVAAAANKVFHTELCQEIARRAFEWGGVAPLAEGARIQQLWRQSLWETIGGGTSEVMRGVIARQGLHLDARR